jgi:hypothetical protein
MASVNHWVTFTTPIYPIRLIQYGHGFITELVDSVLLIYKYYFTVFQLCPHVIVISLSCFIHIQVQYCLIGMSFTKHELPYFSLTCSCSLVDTPFFFFLGIIHLSPLGPY